MSLQKVLSLHTWKKKCRITTLLKKQVASTEQKIEKETSKKPRRILLHFKDPHGTHPTGSAIFVLNHIFHSYWSHSMDAQGSKWLLFD